MADQNSFQNAFIQLVRAWTELQWVVARWKEEEQQSEAIGVWKATWDPIITGIDQYNVQYPIRRLGRFYLQLDDDLHKVVNRSSETIIRTYQQRIFLEIVRATISEGLVGEGVDSLAILTQAFGREQVPLEIDEHVFLAVQRDVGTALWEGLKPSLIAMVFRRKWLRSWEAAGWFNTQVSYPTASKKAEALASLGFSHLWEDIRGARLDPNRNIHGLLVWMVHLALQREYHDLWGRETNPLNETYESTHESWEEIVERVANDQATVRLWQYIDTLRPDERHIIYRRWHDDPPGSSVVIAQELGDGWNENRVNVAHHRILKKIRRNLVPIPADEEGVL